MYKYKKAKRHHFNKNCCRIIKLRGNASRMLLEHMGLKRENTNLNNEEINNNINNGITNNNFFINRDYTKTNQRLSYMGYRNNKQYKPLTDNQYTYTPQKDEGNGFTKSFGQSTKVIVIGGDGSNNLTKSFKLDQEQDKENIINSSEQKQKSNLSQSQMQQQQQQTTDVSQALPQIMQMLFEIKNQNLYLIERNIELEQVINTDIRPCLEDGFYTLRNEIRDLKKTQKSQDQQIRKQIRINKTTQKKSNVNYPKRYQQTQQLNYVTNEVVIRTESNNSKIQQTKHHQAATVNVQNLQLASGAESTFMRKLEETVLIPSHNQQQQQQTGTDDSMRFSIGANLLELMAIGSKDKPQQQQQQQYQIQQQEKKRGAGRRVRNFNFRANLNEIDKIIEEDLNENVPTIECSNYAYSNGTSPAHKMEQINKEIMKMEEQEQLEQTIPLNFDGKYQSEEKRNNGNNGQESRPQTAAQKDGAQKQQRKGWGTGANSRPKTGAAVPLRIGKGMISRVGSGTGQNDNILALLAQDSEELKEVCRTEVIENQNQLSNDVSMITDQQQKSNSQQDSEMKIEDLKSSVAPQINQIKPPLTNNNAIQRVVQPRKRGMFKPPPSDLLEQLLLEDQNSSNQDDSGSNSQQQVNKSATPTKVQSPFDNQGNIKVNNFMTESHSKSRSRSRKRLITNNNQGNNNILGVKKIVFNKPIGIQQNLNAKLNLQIFDESDDDEENKSIQKSQNNKNKNANEDDNPFQSTSTLLGNLQGKQDSEEEKQKIEQNSKEVIGKKRQQMFGNNSNKRQQMRSQNNVKSIEELLKGETQFDQDEQQQDIQQDNTQQQTQYKQNVIFNQVSQQAIADNDSQQFTQTEKQSIFFINNGHKKLDSNDNTGEFGTSGL